MTTNSARYRDRVEAGRRLGEALGPYRGQDLLVLGIPRGGVPVAVEVARALDAELDIVVARKLGAPGQPELAIGAVTANGGQYLNEEYIGYLGVTPEYVARETERKMAEAREREEHLRAGQPMARIRDRVVIVVDDGLATGATMRAALRSVRKGGPAQLVMAVPVGALESCRAMQAEADVVLCLSQPPQFRAVGLHYDRFDPVEETAVRRMLEEARVERSRRAAPAGGSQRSIDFPFTNDLGQRLAGTLELPADAAPVPVVIFAHGMGSGRMSHRNREIAGRLLIEGIGAFLIDFTGHGDSEGRMEQATVERMVADLSSAIEAVRQHAAVDATRIGVSGSSSGGVVALVLTAGDERVKALVLRSVPAHGLEHIAPHVRVPTLVIAGEQDWPIVRDDEALTALIGGEHRFVVIPEAGHLFEGPGQSVKVADLSAKWFADQLTLGALVRSGGV
jgi:putative phosphoribosyl transferase